MKNILVINGPNLNFLGIREPDIYGDKTLRDLEQMIAKKALELKVNVFFFQSNHEGAIVDEIQRAYGSMMGERSFPRMDGIIINAAGYTHTSVAIPDAIKAVGIDTVEVHISDITSREDFRKHSYIKAVCIEQIYGKGFQGYLEALEVLAKR